MHETVTLSTSDCLSTELVTSIAAVLDVDPLSVPVLQESVDMDALRTLVDSERSAGGNVVTVTFRIAGCEVQVSSEGVVTVTDEPGTLAASAPVRPVGSPAFEEGLTHSEAESR